MDFDKVEKQVYEDCIAQNKKLEDWIMHTPMSHRGNGILEQLTVTSNSIDMEYKITHNDFMEFNPEHAEDGDMYLYQGGKLIYMGNTLPEPVKPSFWSRIKKFFTVKVLNNSTNNIK